MFSTCLFCHGRLNTNARFAHVPVGHRFAFDPQRGRLWIVCTRCFGWNLWPFDSRLDGLEELEKAFEGARRRVSTDQITLASIAPGVDLIRIGRPTQAEFASWRYVNRIRHRRRMRFAQLGATAGAVGLLAGGSALALMSSTVMVGGYAALAVWGNWWALRGGGPGDRSPMVKVVTSRDVITLSEWEIRWGVRLEPMGKTGWHLAISDYEAIEGPAAVQALAQILPIANRWGGSRGTVVEAVRKLGALNDPQAIFRHAVRHTPMHLFNGSAPLMIALEMAAHESAERAAMAGELALLERAWREAERIAAIADGLLIPDSIHRLLIRMKAGSVPDRTA